MLRGISIECASLRNLTAGPEVNDSPKGTAVVSASIVNNEFYGCAEYGVGRISLRDCASLQVSIMGIMAAITTTTIVISTKANPTGTTTAPTARRSTCICEQMPVSELAVMMQGRRQLQRRMESVKKRMEGIMAKTRQLAQLR